MPKGKKHRIRVSDRMTAVMEGTLKIEDLDDEEIFRGQIRSDSGDFRGRPSDYIPRKFYVAATQELMQRWQAKVNSKLDPALKVLEDIMQNPKLPADARYKSAVYLIERAAGKVPEKTEMKVELAKWEEDLEDLIYDPNEKK